MVDWDAHNRLQRFLNGKRRQRWVDAAWKRVLWHERLKDIVTLNLVMVLAAAAIKALL